MSLMNFLSSTMFLAKSNFDRLPVQIRLLPSEDEVTFAEIGAFECRVSTHKAIDYSFLVGPLIRAANALPNQNRRPFVDYFFELEVLNVFEQTVYLFNSEDKVQVPHLKIQDGHLVATFYYSTVLIGPED